MPSPSRRPARPRPRTALAALATAVALSAAGCAGDDTADVDATRSTGSTTTTESTTTTTTEPTTTTTLPPTTATYAVGAALPTGPTAPVSPAFIAQQIERTERAIRNPATSPSELPSLAHEQQVAYRAVSADLAKKGAVLAALPDDLRPVADANITAGAKLRAMITKPKDTLPPWRIVTPAPADELLGYYKEAEATSGVGWTYLASIHLVETRMGRIRGTSTAGAQGPMQFLPSTWTQYGEGGDINSNRDAIHAASRLLKRNGAPGDMRNAIFNYNRDTRYVDAVITFAAQMQADERAYRGYHGWQVYYLTTKGDVWLPEGYQGA